MSHEPDLKTIQSHWPQTLKLYLIGFVFCVILTSLSFSIPSWGVFPRSILITLLIGLAVLQAFVQLIYFMHMGKEAKPRWMILLFYFMVLILLIIVLGSLWIMHDLNQRVMPEMLHW